MRYQIYFILLMVALTLFSCGGKEEKKEKKTKSTGEVQKKEGLFESLKVEGFQRDEASDEFIPNDENSYISYISIQSQRCENCERMKNLNNFREEVSLANEFKNAYAKEINGKTVFFAEMKAKTNARADEEFGPVITAEFMNDKSTLIMVSVVPREIPDDKELNFSKEIEKFVEALTAK